MKPATFYTPPLVTDPIAQGARQYATAHGDGTLALSQALKRAYLAGARDATSLAANFVPPRAK